MRSLGFDRGKGPWVWFVVLGVGLRIPSVVGGSIPCPEFDRLSGLCEVPENSRVSEVGLPKPV